MMLTSETTPALPAELLPVAAKVFWWGTPQEALLDPARFVAQVMVYGDWQDVQSTKLVLGERAFLRVLENPPSGVFDLKSWHYWHWYFHLYSRATPTTEEIMTPFQPRLDILPEPQRRLWPELAQVPKCFVLYGGTGLSLRLGHRQSVDFDFFTHDPVAPEGLLRSIPFLAKAKILQSEGRTLTVVIQRGGMVKLSFFGGLTMGRIQDPQETQDGILLVASLLDLAGMKAKVIQQRAEAKDYLDILALLESGIELPVILGAGQALFQEQYNPMVTLKALTYFGDGNLHTLSQRQQDRLIQAASQPFQIPDLQRQAETLSPQA